MSTEARKFSSSQNYAAGDLVVYSGVLYEFTSAHNAGAWTGEDAVRVDQTIQPALTRIMAGADHARRSTAYAETIIFEPGQIEGTRYKYVLTNADDPRD